MSELVVRDDALDVVAPAQLTPIEDPRAFVAGYVRIADQLAEIVRTKGLATRIRGRDHVRVEGWTLLGSMLGAFPITVWSRPVRDDDGRKTGWEARVEVRTRDGALIGAAEAECLREEKTWADRDDYALRSMAQTRATSKAMRQPLGFVMTLAGFDATPAEEMPRDQGSGASNAGVVAGGRGRAPGPVCEHANVAEEVDGAERRCADCGARLATGPMVELLNVLYGKITRGHEYRKPAVVRSAGGDPDMGDDWQAIRDRLTVNQAHAAIDRLQRAMARFEAEARADAAVEGTPIA